MILHLIVYAIKVHVWILLIALQGHSIVWQILAKYKPWLFQVWVDAQVQDDIKILTVFSFLTRFKILVFSTKCPAFNP